MSTVASDWLPYFQEEAGKEYYKELTAKVKSEYAKYRVFPPKDQVFSAFSLTSYKDVKVVIIGQDPYHNVGQAHGLCFSVQKGIDVPPSLQNIYQELHDDLGCYIPNNGMLNKWAEQGVLLLNT
ncbi:MAG: uracil-DNA glycosylase, partial [Lachnospiraceae bacterium]|nr:uracil-DNA glycosylase [Lachnospiraceae bacterium]